MKTTETARLHHRWCTNRVFVRYKPPPAGDDQGDMELWCERARYLARDLHWLLCLPHAHFWSQVVFDDRLQGSLDSYLQLAPRPYDGTRIPAAASKLHGALHRLVFLVFLRVGTLREDEEHFITPSVYGEIIYENYLFDLPRMLDLCALYGQGNQAIVMRILGNVFTNKPEYKEDFKDVISTILQAFTAIAAQCGANIEASARSAPPKLESLDLPVTGAIAIEELSGLLGYLCDISVTLSAFVACCTTAQPLLLRQDFLPNIASFYEQAVPRLEVLIGRNEQRLGEVAWQQLATARHYLLKTCHDIVFACCLQPVLETGEEGATDHVEDFLQIFLSLLHEKRFLADWDRLHPVGDDLHLLQVVCPSMDEIRAGYVSEAVKQAHLVMDTAPESQHTRTVVKKYVGADMAIVGAATSGDKQDCVMNKNTEAMPALPLEEVQLESLVSAVRDVLPHLGEGFVAACLRHLASKALGPPEDLAATLIRHVLEDTLPTSLASLDPGMPREATIDTEQEKEMTDEVLDSRRNIFDGDEFDAFSQSTMDWKRVYKGKRNNSSFQKVMNDHSELFDVRHRFAPYSLVSSMDNETEENNLTVEDSNANCCVTYEDEYDDTYDGARVGANDADIGEQETNASLLHFRPFVTPRVLEVKRRNKDDAESEEERGQGRGRTPAGVSAGGESAGRGEAGERAADVKDRRTFLEDPAKLRAQAEERRASMGWRRGQNTAGRSKAVCGGPRGRGQSQDTEVARRRKEENKARQGNHGRRDRAAHKRGRGMIPF
uniref:activating signal cointegrator 1 complex subunit 2 isoform X2 n=1 Tax=Myxine glutinosa TaxID=7769 RepID=UPI00358E162A